MYLEAFRVSSQHHFTLGILLLGKDREFIPLGQPNGEIYQCIRQALTLSNRTVSLYLTAISL
jgi:hypothetical protein